MKESELLSYALTLLKKSGLVYWRVPNQATIHQINGRTIMKKSPIKGFPDIAGVFPTGKFWAIELKTEAGRLSDEQTQWITRLNLSGAIALVLRSKEEISSFVEAAMQFKNRRPD